MADDDKQLTLQETLNALGAYFDWANAYLEAGLAQDKEKMAELEAVDMEEKVRAAIKNTVEPEAK